MDRQLKEIKLGKSGYTAKVVAFFLRGEQKEIDSKRYEGAEIAWEGDGVRIKNIPVDYRQKEEDVMLLQGVKEIRKPDGTVLPVTKETLDDLPDEDVRALLFELQKVLAGEEQGKKK